MAQKKKPPSLPKTTKTKKKQPLAVEVELKLRQEELELINRELAQSHVELEAAYRQYTDLYDFAPVGYFTLTRNGAIHQVNLAGANLLGVNHNEATQLRLAAFVSSESRPAFDVFFEKLLSAEGKEACELMLEKKEHGLLWVRLEATCFVGGDVCRAMLTDITEHKRVEQILQESENRFRTLLQDVSTVAVQGYAIDGTTQYWNTASERLYGYSAEEAHGQSLLDLIIPPEMRSDVWHAIQQMGETGQPIPAAELSLMHKDGSRVDVYSSHAIVSVPGRMPELFCLDVDLTERKRAEKALQESESRYRELIELAVDGILIGSPEGIIIGANSYMLHLTGRTLNNLVGRHVNELFNPDELKNTPLRYDLLQKGETVTNERQLVRPDGKVVPIEMHTKMMPNGTYQSIYRDITERKQAEELLKESEWRTRIVSELTTDYIFVVDVDSNGILKFRWASDNLFRMTGRTIEDVATVEKWGDIIHPDDRDRFFDFVKQILSTAESGEFECRSVYKQGNERWIRIFARPQVDEGNRVTAIVGAIQDITERKQVQGALAESEKKLRALFETMSEGIVYEDHDGKIISANPAAERLLGLSFDQMQGRTSVDPRWKAIHEDGSPFPGETHSLNLAAKIGKPATGEVMGVFNPKSDTYVWLSVNSTPEFLTGEKKPFRAYAVFRDITERKQTEASLRESEKLYRNMNENSPLGMHFYKLNNNNQLIFVGANPAADKLLGLDNSQFIGKPIEEAFPPLIQTEVPLRYRDAAEKSIPWSTEQIVYADKKITGAFDVRAFQTLPGNMVAIFADITERKQAEQALETANRELQTALALQQQLAHTDALTGINNRRQLYELAEHEFEIAARYLHPLSAIMFDIDHFKEVNDTFGHAIGDQILQRVTQVACVNLRSADVIGRYGGEEFVIILPMTNAKQAYPLAERIRVGVEAIRVPTEKGDAAVTLSIGIVEMIHVTQHGSAESLIRRADEAMYAAKQAGRNRTDIGK